MNTQTPSTGLYWFRRDLRLHDNRALQEISQTVDRLLPVYCLDPALFAPLQWAALGSDFPKMGWHRARFLLEALAELKANLQAVGSGLLILLEAPQSALPRLAQQHNASLVVASQDIGTEELSEEQQVNDALRQVGASLKLVWQHTLLEPDSLPFAMAQLPRSYTAFRNKSEHRAEICQPEPGLVSLPGLPETLAKEALKASLSLSGLPLQEPDWSLYPPETQQAERLHGGENQALDRLHHYFWQTDGISRYKETRNGLLGLAYSSKFSPYLALGCLSARTVYAELKRYEAERSKNESTYWLWVELLWRDYFTFLLWKEGRRLFFSNGLAEQRKVWKQDKTVFEAWMQGKTGYPLVDACMRELAATGFMSNRGRQNVASFLTKTLGIDWRWGAAWFESCLIDYDVASNWGNWAYQAGVGTDSRDRRFNVVKQAYDYDPQARFIKHWLPELTDFPPARAIEPWKLTTLEAGLFHTNAAMYPERIIYS